MELVFVSNMLNHHQMELCKELSKKFDKFYFVATENEENIGYQKSQNADFVINYYESESEKKAIEKIRSADVAIFGACPNSLIEERMKMNKLSFLYSERFFKKGTWRRFIPSTRKKVVDRIIKYKNKNMYVLCASAYLSYDLYLMGFPIEKCYKWGYFPDLKTYNIDNLLRKKKDKPMSILWVGRLVDWKHPDLIIKLAEKLRKNNIVFKINIVGDGPLRKKIENLIERKNLDNCIKLFFSKTPSEVRTYMEDANIFLTTSDYYEGWGAVLNEAMNSGCAVVASHAAGSTSYLINNNTNGQIYEFGNDKMLYNKVLKYIIEQDFMRNMQRNAYKTIADIWNAKVAASNLKKLIDAKINSTDIEIELGPCSKAF